MPLLGQVGCVSRLVTGRGFATSCFGTDPETARAAEEARRRCAAAAAAAAHSDGGDLNPRQIGSNCSSCRARKASRKRRAGSGTSDELQGQNQTGAKLELSVGPGRQGQDACAQLGSEAQLVAVSPGTHAPLQAAGVLEQALSCRTSSAAGRAVCLRPRTQPLRH